MHIRCITNQKEHNLKESRLMLPPMEKNAHSGGGTVSSPGVRTWLFETFFTVNFLQVHGKNKNDNKGTVIYLLHLTPSKNLIQTITI